jgi:hypothetical protein
MATVQYRHIDEQDADLPFISIQLSTSILPNDSEPQIKSDWAIERVTDLHKNKLYRFDMDNGSFRPARIEVNGRKGRESCVVVGEDHRQVRIYDIGNSRI